MTKLNWTDITREDVIEAIEDFLKYEPEYPEPRHTFLIYKGKRLPAKHIRGMAFQKHYGVAIRKSEFGGGMETVRFFNRLGFEMEYLDKKTGISNYTKEDKQTSENKKKNTKKNIDKEKKVQKEKQIGEGNTDKIIISSKKVIEQKNALQLILNRMFDGDIVCEKTFSWLKTPEKIEGVYKNLYNALSAYRGDCSFAKKNVSLRCDFVCESKKLIIEYDERQHFTEARRISLEAYREIDVLYDRSMWIKACSDICAKDNSPVNRDEIRAYYDSTRDIECSRNGYKLIRIMHGQIDFEAEDAKEKLAKYMDTFIAEKTQDSKMNSVKVAMYLQTNEFKNKKEFNKIIPIMKNADADLIVFPEYCYVPFVDEMVSKDILLEEDQHEIFSKCLDLSREIGKAIIVNSCDKYDTIFSIYANANPASGETETNLYIKHTMCGSSCLEFKNYPDYAPDLFNPILLNGKLIGMTICYDCNHALFSRMYGMYGIDLIVNSTGGNVVYDKWFKYNKARAIENNCYTLVTMGGDGLDHDNNYVFGFNKNGGQLSPKNICGKSNKNNIPGGLYVYEIGDDECLPETDNSNQVETENKKWNFEFPVSNTIEVLKSSAMIDDKIFCKRVEDSYVFFLLVDGDDIMKPEVVQKLLYSKHLKKFDKRKYIIINRHDVIDEKFFEEKLSVILKVRAMENFCAVVLQSSNINKCYQCGKNRTAQVVKAKDGYWKIDLERTSGPEAIWKNKSGMRASWRKHYEWLVENAEVLYNDESLK